MLTKVLLLKSARILTTVLETGEPDGPLSKNRRKRKETHILGACQRTEKAM